MKILFQGDSLTDAFRKPEEINAAFQLGNGYAFLVAASLGAPSLSASTLWTVPSAVKPRSNTSASSACFKK
jgi:hypothetical protein